MNKLAAALLLCLASLTASTEIRQHHLTLTLDPASHRLTAVDTFSAVYKGSLEFRLGPEFAISRLLVNGKEQAARVVSPSRSGERGQPVTYRVAFPFWKKGAAEVVVEYAGEPFEDTGQASFSREKIAMSITATISEEGVFLSPDGGFYPAADERLAHFETHIHLPAGWDAVSEGDRLAADKTEEAAHIYYRTAHPMENIHVSAARWVVQQKTSGGVDFYTFFFPEDTSLARQYLDMSIRYVELYADLISPYPFSKFAVVENFFPTGYGMPSYTVLGRSVVRLPFIVYTSLGHEVLHNWWGNSVYVGAGGNWCEGLTTYQADYLYKLQSSEEAARQYRKDVLKDYTVYTDQARDLPPAEFTRRSDMSTRSVGYGKVAMIFHMLEEQLGADHFLQALRDVVKNYQWSGAGWDDFFAAFEAATGKELKAFKAAWVDEPGAPLLKLVPGESGFRILQTEAIKPIWIPIRLIYASGDTVTTTIFSDREWVDFVPDDPDELVEVAVDPDFHLIRRLHESELDATLRNILSGETYEFIVPEKSADWESMATAFQGALGGSGLPQLRLMDEPRSQGTSIFLGTLPPDQGAIVQGGRLRIGEASYEAATHALVWAYKQEEGRYALVIYSESREEIMPLARKIPHYGKYGYLVFQGGQNVLKGNHEARESLLVWRRGQ